MKKLLILLLLLTLAFALSGCSDDATYITSVDQLQTATIGVQRGTTGHLFVEDSFPDATVNAFSESADAVMALIAGSIDAVVIDNLVAARFTFRHDGIMVLDGELTTEPYGIAFPLGSPYTTIFNDALQTLRNNGTFDAIYDYWINENPEASRYVSPAGTTHPNGVLRMGTSAGFEPFEFFEGPNIVGFDICLVNAIGDVIGYEIEVVNMDFDAIILAVQTGQVDFGMAGMTITEVRRQQVDFSDSYFMAGQVAIVREPS